MALALVIFIEFFKTGLFAIGGGLATLPFLYHLGHAHSWYSAEDLSQMLALSSIMPGPIGINIVTYAGFTIKGFWGAFIAVGGVMAPSIIFVILISKILKHFKESQVVKSILYTIKPASCAMVSAVGFKMLKDAVFKPTAAHNFSIDYFALILLIVLAVISLKSKKGPLFYLGLSALVGVCLGIAHFH